MKRQKFAKKFGRKYNNDKNYRKVKNHCHYEGKYRGAAHSICILQYSTSKDISVVFQNIYQFSNHGISKFISLL